jgi:hypothetical protein
MVLHQPRRALDSMLSMQPDVTKERFCALSLMVVFISAVVRRLN